MQKQQVPTAGLDDQPASISTSHCPSLALSHNPQAGPPIMPRVLLCPTLGVCAPHMSRPHTHTLALLLAIHPPGMIARTGCEFS